MITCPWCGAALPIQATLGWAHHLLERGVAVVAPGAAVLVYPAPNLPSFAVLCRRCRSTVSVSADAPAAST